MSERALSWSTLIEKVREREDTPLLSSSRSSNSKDDAENQRDIWSHRWIPGNVEEEDKPKDVVHASQPPRRHRRHSTSRHRSWRRRIFLLLTDPTTSYFSMIFFVIVMIAIFAINVIMVMQTMDVYQFTPTDCVSCGGNTYYVLEDDNFVMEKGIQCVCPPAPLTWTVQAADYIVYFFTVEWILRVAFFEPPPAERAPTWWGYVCQWFGFLTDTTTVLDALAIFPYYAERFEKTNGLMSLRLLRLFRVFQLVRLGQYNSSFMSLTNVLFKSILYLKLLAIVLMFGAAFFGSIVYWLEKGDWTYYEETQSYQFMRKSVDGIRTEPTPFTSIPVAFWWFCVTATTVGYGDIYPTSVGGRCVAAMAMLMGVLVIAFPVSVFSDLWSNELKQRGVDYEDMLDDDAESEASTEQENGVSRSVRFSDEIASVSEQSGISSIRLTERSLAPTIFENRVVLEEEDVHALTKHLQTMEKSQERIRGILAKYDIET